MGIQDMISLHEAGLIPDEIQRKAIRSALAAWLQESSKPTAAEQLSVVLDFVRYLKTMPINVKSEKANDQLYELPNEFWKLVMGKHMLFSASYFPNESTSFDDAEEAMMELRCERAQIKDGQTILDLGCGWGSFCIHIAEKYKNCKITGITYSRTQKEYTDQICSERGLHNVEIIHADIGTYEMEATFDRVVVIETYEYMANYAELQKKISKWMKEDGLLFIQHICHKTFPHLFKETESKDVSIFEGHGHEWFAKYFFTGGIFLSANLLLFFQEDVSIVDQWMVSGEHYSQTGTGYLKNFDKNISAIKPIMETIFGKDAVKWTAYWRTSFFFLEELFGYNNGNEWMTGHYLFKKK